MELKGLGNTDTLVPEIGLGTWRYRGEVEPLQRGIELGARFIDTAEIYGTEEIVGRAIRGQEVFVATKVSGQHLGYDDVLRAAEKSLQRLGIDVIDLYQIHWPNARVPLQETMRAMAQLVDRGWVRYLGVSNFSVSELRDAQAAMTTYPIVSNQVLYHLNCRDIEHHLLPYCQEHRITIIAYTPLDSGRLATAVVGRGHQRLQVLAQVADEVQKSPAQVALNWCTAHASVVAIPKSNRRARVEENVGASGWRLSPDQMQRLDAAFA